jgi:hypothetical protein
LEIESTPGKKGSKRFLAEFADAWLSMTGAASGGVLDRRAAIFNCALRRGVRIETAAAAI